MALAADDMVQFASQLFRVHVQSPPDRAGNAATGNGTQLCIDSACQRALDLVLFDKLMSERAVTPLLQPIVDLKDRKTSAFEVFARSPLVGMETAEQMFDVAKRLSMEVELSAMLRWKSVEVLGDMVPRPHLFLNTHPLELADDRLGQSLEHLRENWPDQALTLEIHESAVAQGPSLAQLGSLLKRLDIKLAYNDFGVGECA